MFQLANPSAVAAGSRGPVIPVAATQYLQNVFNATKDKQLSHRDTRELRTLATCLDHLAKGEVECLGDVLMQRFKSIEMATTDTPREVAELSELVPPEKLTVMSQDEQLLAARARLKKAKLEDVLRRSGKHG